MSTFRLEMIGGPLDGCWVTLRVDSLDLGDGFLCDWPEADYPAYIVSEWRGSARWVVLYSATESGNMAAYRTRNVEGIDGMIQ